MWRLILVFLTTCSGRPPAPVSSPITTLTDDPDTEIPRPQTQWEPQALYCSDLCSTEGRCDYKDGECITTNAEDCYSISKGWGDWVVKEGRCVDISDCSEECAELGACVMYYGSCQPLNDDDCTKSEICQKEGACKMMIEVEDMLEGRYCGKPAP